MIKYFFIWHRKRIRLRSVLGNLDERTSATNREFDKYFHNWRKLSRTSGTSRDIREKAKRGRLSTQRVMNGLGHESFIEEKNEVDCLLRMESLVSSQTNRDEQALKIAEVRNEDIRVKINVSGSHYETRRRTLEQWPKTRLCKMLFDHSLADGVEVDEFGVQTFYFDRHAPSFPALLYFYQKKEMVLYRPLDVPMEVFVEEVIFFELAQHVLEDDYEDAVEIEYRTSCINSRNLIWAIFEKPETSKLAKIVTFVSIFFILISTISFCLETLPSFEPDCAVGMYQLASNANETHFRLPDWSPKSKGFYFWLVETTCIGFFTIEYVLRFYAAPRRWPFVKDFMNVIDLVAILPYYVVMILNIISSQNTGGLLKCVPEGAEDSSTLDGKFLTVLRVVRLARIVRIAKLSRHSRNLNTLIKTFRQSLRELSFLMLFFIVSMVLFATFVYFCEEGENDFNSIPHSFWWAIVTMTTVGYGDMYPRTGPGKLVGFLCAICGVLCIALPVPSIVSNFHRLYQEDQIMNPHGDYTYRNKDEEIRCKLRKKFLNEV